MSWNRPSEENHAIRVKKKPSILKRKGFRLSVGCVLAAAFGIAACLLVARSDSPTENITRQRPKARIGEVRIAAKPTPTQDERKAKPRTKEVLRRERALAAAERRRKALSEQKPLKLFSDDSYYSRIFDNHIDRSIADMIDTEPGDTIIGSSENLYSSDDFTRQFLESIKTPIIVSHDDPEDVAELKRAVTQAKIEMKARYDDGEDLAKIMIAARDELKNLYEFKKEIVAELEKATADKDLDEASVNAMVDAVNRVMEEKGMRKLSMPITTALRFQRMRERSQHIGE